MGRKIGTKKKRERETERERDPISKDLLRLFLIHYHVTVNIV